MRKTEEEQIFLTFMNLENKLVENQRQIMYIVENKKLINDNQRLGKMVVKRPPFGGD